MYALMTMLIAGALSTAAFDFFGQSLSPWLGYSALAPVPLANQTIQTFTGAPFTPGAYFLHYLAGMIAYPLGWMLIVDPLRKAIWPAFPWLLAALLYGVALWVFALYIMAHLVNGNPPFLVRTLEDGGWAFSGITWVALIGHVLFAVVTAAIVEWRGSRRAAAVA